ncbi:MAG: hypothetical protein ACRDQA_15715 [Nocardioidaceae bacterium]
MSSQIDPILDKLVRRIAGTERRVRALEAGPQLAYSSIEDGSIDGYDEDGNQTVQFGNQYDGTYTAASLTGPNPPAPSAPILVAATQGLIVKWDGRFANPGAVAPMDFARVDVHTSDTPDFNAVATAPQTSFTSARGGTAFISLPVGTHYVALIAVSESGKASAQSLEVSGESLDIPETAPVTPSSSPAPTVTGGIRSLFVKWQQVANATPVTYDVYVSTTAGFTPGPSTLALSTPASLAVVTALADGTELDYETVYYVVIVARSGDQYADPSAQASGSPVQVNSPDIAAEAITADLMAANSVMTDALAAGSVDAGKLAAEILLASLIRAGEIDDTTGEYLGGHWEGDGAGIRFFSKDGTLIISLPTAEDESAQIRAHIQALSATFYGAVTFRNTNNEISADSGIYMASGTTAPKTGPSLSPYWPSIEVQANTDDANIAGLAYGNGLWWRTLNARGTASGDRIESFDNTGTIVQTIDVDLDPRNGVTVVGDELFVLGHVYGNANDQRHLYVYDVTTGVFKRKFPYARDPVKSSQSAALGRDDLGNLVVAHVINNGDLYVMKFSTVDGAQIGNDIVCTVWPPYARYVTGVYQGSSGFDQERIVVSTGANFLVLNTAGSYPVSRNFAAAYGEEVQGFCHDGTNFRSLSKTNLYTYSQEPQALLTWWGETWRQDGNYETDLSPLTRYLIPRRAGVKISVGSLPAVTGTITPDSASVYAIAATSEPDPATLVKQVDLPAGITNTTLPALAATGDPPPPANTFPASVPGWFSSADGSFYVDGDGKGQWLDLEGRVQDLLDARPQPDWGHVRTSMGANGYITVDHDLGVTPSSVQITVQGQWASAGSWMPRVTDASPTSFRVWGRYYNNTTVNSVVGFYWVAHP